MKTRFVPAASNPFAQRTPLRRGCVIAALSFSFLLKGAVSDAAPQQSVDAAAPNRLSSQELNDGWILLFDGETPFGWTATGPANWLIADGTITVSQGRPSLFRTTNQFGDYELLVDFRASPETNSGIFLRTSPRPNDPARDCYELNIASPELSPFPTGSFVGRKKRSATPTPASAPSDGWHTYRVRAEGGRFQVWLDNQRVLDYHDPRPRGRGYIGLQFNQGPVGFRNVKLRPLGLKPLFNGRDLRGWRTFAGKPARFAVNDRQEITVRSGPGQLETEQTFADFTLQLEVFVDGEGLNSGIFFRSIPGKFWQGYECQIENRYHDDDRTRPVDCGTGGFYRRQNARRIVADDRRWFCLTLVACDNRMAAWVDGIQVSDWVDRRAANPNPRRGLRLDAGTIILQAHDPTTNLRFRNVRAGEIAPR